MLPEPSDRVPAGITHRIHFSCEPTARVLAEDEAPHGRPPATAEAEEEAHTDIVKRLFQQKRRLRVHILEDRTWYLSSYSGDVIAALARIDTLPLDVADDVTVATVQRLESGTAPVTLIEDLNHLAEYACKVAINRVLDEAEGDDPLFPERFRRTGESWVRRAVADEYLKILDTYQVLDLAAEAAFAPSAVERIEQARIRIDFATRNFAAAVPRVRGLLASGETDELKRLLATAYRGWINVAPPAPDPADIDHDFASWTDPQSVRDRRFLMAGATLAGLKGAPGATITAAMERLLAADPGNRHAEFHLIVDGVSEICMLLELEPRLSAHDPVVRLAGASMGFQQKVDGTPPMCLGVEDVDRAEEGAHGAGQGVDVGFGGGGQDRAGVLDDHVGQERRLISARWGHDEQVLLEGHVQPVQPQVQPDAQVAGAVSGQVAGGQECPRGEARGDEQDGQEDGEFDDHRCAPLRAARTALRRAVRAAPGFRSSWGPGRR